MSGFPLHAPPAPPAGYIALRNVLAPRLDVR